MLEVTVGLLFTFMLLSLLGTTVNELIGSWRGWRGFYLEEGLKRLLEFKDDPKTFEKFINNPYYKQMLQHKAPLRVSQAPAFLSSSNFISILVSALKSKEKAEKVEDLLDGLPQDSQLRKVLKQLKEEGHENLESYKSRLQGWFDDVMWQASGWYKRHMQFVTFFVGFSIAIVFNANTFQVYSHLTSNAGARQKLNALAENFVNKNATLPSVNNVPDTLGLGEIRATVGEFIRSDEFAKTSNILGLGWDAKDLSGNWKDWLYRLLGWCVTAFAISLGAPFWFDMLKKIITLKSADSSAKNETAPQVIINTGGDVKTPK